MTEKLFLDDREIAMRLGVKPNLFSAIAKTLEKSGFPQPDPLFEDKRYWPACRSFLDRRHNVHQDAGGGDAPLQLDGKENW
ncbi:winged helix-turn-helix domain-containing protein [Aureimonas phyllosphaerae]|uniref:Winged helix-turn-helix DNA-binding n=1 Tax=Aureimonas phyllosphaerae TaxID=1166078 RepID=A0A7W6BWX7_9HYPH|nr:winged helix-turn-helix domain-containing protein [Aureimonas phyllosphaerae]MBB3937895.1 hypothetical protein [Aureimonas phyllosphaerae]MBB3961932.1 hypothetical protein [Aureimonas phyllosphaerae]SFF54789.1 hypothetical protein SAMN05216566_12559 [Aureimonas phyllosphaerae]